MAFRSGGQLCPHVPPLTCFPAPLLMESWTDSEGGGRDTEERVMSVKSEGG